MFTVMDGSKLTVYESLDCQKWPIKPNSEGIYSEITCLSVAVK